MNKIPQSRNIDSYQRLLSHHNIIFACMGPFGEGRCGGGVSIHIINMNCRDQYTVTDL